MLLVAGNLVYDWIGGPVEELAWDTTVWPEHFSAGLGGNGATTAYAAAYLGAAVRLITASGGDSNGDACRRMLERAGVEPFFSHGLKGETALTMGLFRADGARALIHRPGVLEQAFTDIDSLAPYAEGIDWLHVANPFAVPVLRERAPLYLSEACDRGWTTSLDTGWDRKGQWIEVIGPCLPYVEWFFTNEAEAAALTGKADFREAAVALRALGAANVVIKRGARGCAMALGRAAIVEVPAHSVKVIDTTGAGDCFCGGFIAALMRELDPADAARVANVCGALSASAAGSTTGLTTWRETTRLAGLWQSTAH